MVMSSISGSSLPARDLGFHLAKKRYTAGDGTRLLRLMTAPNGINLSEDAAITVKNLDSNARSAWRTAKAKLL